MQSSTRYQVCVFLVFCVFVCMCELCVSFVFGVFCVFFVFVFGFVVYVFCLFLSLRWEYKKRLGSNINAK